MPNSLKMLLWLHGNYPFLRGFGFLFVSFFIALTEIQILLQRCENFNRHWGYSIATKVGLWWSNGLWLRKIIAIDRYYSHYLKRILEASLQPRSLGWKRSQTKCFLGDEHNVYKAFPLVSSRSQRLVSLIASQHGLLANSNLVEFPNKPNLDEQIWGLFLSFRSKTFGYRHSLRMI